MLFFMNLILQVSGVVTLKTTLHCRDSRVNLTNVIYFNTISTTRLQQIQAAKDQTIIFSAIAIPVQGYRSECCSNKPSTPVDMVEVRIVHDGVYEHIDLNKHMEEVLAVLDDTRPIKPELSPIFRTSEMTLLALNKEL